jgi:hypothetical protein
VWRKPDRASGYTRLYFDLDVESAPKVGHEINEGRWFSGPLNFVIWDLDDERFICRVEDEFPVYERDYDYSYEWLVENFLLQGWRAADA